jgi:hypothetical protein
MILAGAAAAAVAGGLGVVSAGDGPPAAAPASRLVTLHAQDPLTHTLDLADGSFGARIEGTRFVEGRAHLDYGTYHEEALTLALEVDDRAHLVDLGHWADLARVHDLEEADGGGVGFASIHFEGSDFRIARRLPKDGFQDLRDARPLLGTVAGLHRLRFQPVVGHVYLVRVEDRQRRGTPVHAKIQVVSHEPGDRVTLRWSPVPGL